MFVFPMGSLSAGCGRDARTGHGPDRQQIERANVTATSLSGGVNRTARTDDKSFFTITFPGGEGDYFMSFTALGFAPRRFEIERTADQEILVVDVQMQRAAAIPCCSLIRRRPPCW